MSCASFQEPKDLKTCLQLLATLHSRNASVNRDIIEDVKAKLKQYCDDEYLDNFTGKNSDGFLFETFSNADKLLRNILGSGDNGEYAKCNETGRFRTYFYKETLFQVFAALYLLYFNTTNCGIKGSGQWHNEHVNGTGSGSRQLAKWFKGNGSDLISRGFDPSALNSSAASGSSLAGILRDLLHHQNAGPLQKALAGLLFLGDWHDSKLGHFICFLRKFSEKCSLFKTKFEALNLPGTYEKFKTLCTELKKNLNPFVNGNSAILYAVCQEDISLYSEIVEANRLGNYVQWLKDHLHSIINALKCMSKDCRSCSFNSLSDATSSGPFKYGFIIKDDDWVNTLKNTLPGHINTLIVSLQCLLVAVYQPSSLKPCLQLFGKLSTTTKLSPKVIDNLKHQVERYGSSNSEYIGSFAKNNGDFARTLNGAGVLLKDILQSEEYGPYDDIKDSDHQDCNCVQSIVHSITTMLPRVYSALYFLYYTTNENLARGMQGGMWANHSLSETHTTLNRWFMDHIGTEAKTGILSRGFQLDKLNPRSGSILVNDLKEIVNHDKAGYIQKVLLGMLFICPWYDTSTGHAILLLKALCEKFQNDANGTMQNKFNVQKLQRAFANFKKLCGSLMSSLIPFVSGTGTVLQGVCWTNTELYNWLGDGDNFEIYLKWLQKHLPYTIGALQSMQTDSINWTKVKLESGESAGPFKYGFIFDDSWEGESIKNKLDNPIRTLTGIIQCFFIALFQPTSLKEHLCLFAKLRHLNDLKAKVVGQLRSNLTGYCDSNYMDKLAGKKSDGYLYNTFDKAEDVIKGILRDNVYGKYSALQDTGHNSCVCIETIVAILSRDSLFEAHTTLLFLYFHVSDERNEVNGAGQWKTEKVSENGHHLYKFLTDDPAMSTLKLMGRGFQGSTFEASTGGSSLATELSKLLRHQNAGPLQNALAGLLFLGDWHDSKLGHAVLFLKEFCDKVSKDQERYQSKYLELGLTGELEQFKNACTELKKNLNPFVTVTASSGVCAVCWNNDSLYEGVFTTGTLDVNEFENCVDWLKTKNIPTHVKNSLEQMSQDSRKWDQNSLKQATLVGSFKYGFVFTKDWDSKIRTLSSAIQMLSGHLSSLNLKLIALKSKQQEQTETSEKRGHSQAPDGPDGLGSPSFSSEGVPAPKAEAELVHQGGNGKEQSQQDSGDTGATDPGVPFGTAIPKGNSGPDPTENLTYIATGGALGGLGALGGIGYVIKHCML